MSKQNIKIAIADDFLTSFANIPKQKQSKVLTFINKFRNNPTSASINYEKINNVKDNNLRSVRIDQGYRGIILKPETGNVFLLLWVDNHDDAYQWAKNRVCKVNPSTGSLQVLNTEIAESMACETSVETPEIPTGLFAGIKDKHLLQLGVPEILLPIVRSINNESELDKIESELPQEVAEALFMLASFQRRPPVIPLWPARRRRSNRPASGWWTPAYWLCEPQRTSGESPNVTIPNIPGSRPEVHLPVCPV